jgi:hypothetical protein
MNMIRARHFGVQPAHRRAVAPHRHALLLTAGVVICAWAMVIGFFDMAVFVASHLAPVIAP